MWVSWILPPILPFNNFYSNILADYAVPSVLLFLAVIWNLHCEPLPTLLSFLLVPIKIGERKRNRETEWERLKKTWKGGQKAFMICFISFSSHLGTWPTGNGSPSVSLCFPRIWGLTWSILLPVTPYFVLTCCLYSSTTTSLFPLSTLVPLLRRRFQANQKWFILKEIPKAHSIGLSKNKCIIIIIYILSFSDYFPF